MKGFERKHRFRSSGGRKCNRQQANPGLMVEGLLELSICVGVSVCLPTAPSLLGPAIPVGSYSGPGADGMAIKDTMRCYFRGPEKF